MLIIEVLAAISEHLGTYLLFIALSTIAAVAINFYFVRNLVSGLIPVQVSFVLNTAVVLFGWWYGAVSLQRVGHHLFYESITVAGVYIVYRRILSDRVALYRLFHRVDTRAISACLFVYNAVILAIVLRFVGGGDSRIAYETTRWYSFLRPIVFILDPLTMLFPIYLLDRGKRLLPLLLIAAAVPSNVFSGSKASLVTSAVLAYLIYRDIKGTRINLSLQLKAFLIMAVSLIAVATLARLNESMVEIGQRMVRTGESAVLVYYSNDPHAAAQGLSTLTKIHRGFARALGDRSAADPDTLFGFALAKIAYGASDLTGPNAQISSYMMCNYSGWENIIGISSIVAYLFTVLLFYRAYIYSPGRVKNNVFLLPFLLVSLCNFPQDYEHGMSDITIMSMCVIFIAMASLVSLVNQWVERSYVTA